MASPPQICCRCTLDSTVPGTRFNEEGVCNTCVEFDTYKDHLLEYFETEDRVPRRLADWCDGVEGLTYEVLLLFSGGKDSTYALSRLVDLGVKVLACVFDNGYIAPVAMRNIEMVCKG